MRMCEVPINRRPGEGGGGGGARAEGIGGRGNSDNEFVAVVASLFSRLSL